MGKKKRILMYALTASASGITQYILNSVDRFDLEAYHFDFVSFRNERLRQWAEAHGATYYEMDVSLYKQPLQYRRYLKRIFSAGYDVVHFHLSSVSDLRQFRYAKACGIPRVIVHSHSSYLDCSNQRKRALFTKIHLRKRRRLPRYADVLCACSSAAAQWMYGGAIPAEEIRFLHNGIDIDRFQYREDVRTAVRKELGVSENTLVVGHVGRFTYQKNHDFLLHVFSEIQRVCPNSRLLLLGGGEKEAEIKRSIQQLAIVGAVSFGGVHANVAEFYQAMDLFILPSHFEGLPIVGVEAQASGLPCLFSSEIAREAAVLEDSCMFLSLNDSYEKWAENAFHIDRPARPQCAGRVREQGYSLEAQIQELEALYR